VPAAGYIQGVKRADDQTERPGAPERPAEAPQVDLRILQANERTLLAWLRTGLALMAFGFVVARIGPWLNEADGAQNGLWSVWTGAAFLVLATICNVAGAIRYIHTRAAIIEERPIIPGSGAVLFLALGLTLLGGLLIVRVLLL
jgi:putative membrane protein